VQGLRRLDGPRASVHARGPVRALHAGTETLTGLVEVDVLLFFRWSGIGDGFGTPRRSTFRTVWLVRRPGGQGPRTWHFARRYLSGSHHSVRGTQNGATGSFDLAAPPRRPECRPSSRCCLVEIHGSRRRGARCGVSSSGDARSMGTSPTTLVPSTTSRRSVARMSVSGAPASA
jgi:hypothetical protein